MKKKSVLFLTKLNYSYFLPFLITFICVVTTDSSNMTYEGRSEQITTYGLHEVLGTFLLVRTI